MIHYPNDSACKRENRSLVRKAVEAAGVREIRRCSPGMRKMSVDISYMAPQPLPIWSDTIVSLGFTPSRPSLSCYVRILTSELNGREHEYAPQSSNLRHHDRLCLEEGSLTIQYERPLPKPSGQSSEFYCIHLHCTRRCKCTRKRRLKAAIQGTTYFARGTSMNLPCFCVQKSTARRNRSDTIDVTSFPQCLVPVRFTG